MKLSDEELSLMDLAIQFRIPLYRLLDEMPYEEYLAWIEYSKVRPIGMAEDYRAAMIMSAFNDKIPIEKVFPSLKPAAKASSVNGLENSMFFLKMQNSVGGKKLELK